MASSLENNTINGGDSNKVSDETTSMAAMSIIDGEVTIRDWTAVRRVREDLLLTEELQDGDTEPKQMRLRHKLAKAALYGMVIPAAITGVYSADVAAVQGQLKDTHPVIRIIDQPNSPDDAHRMVTGINGLGTTSARNVMNALPYETFGLETALEYDKKGIDTTIIKNKVKEFALTHDIDQIVLSGHSMGGDVALEVASLLHIDPEAPEVSDIILDCTPPNLSAVQDDERRAGDAMLTAISNIPGHRNSRILRGTGEMASRYDRYVDPGNGNPLLGRMIDLSDFFEEVVTVKNDKLSPDAGSLGLIEDQLRVIVGDGADESLERMSKAMPDKRIPRVHYLLPHDSDSDGTVKVDKAVDIIVKSALVHDIPVKVYRLPPGTGHANPAQRPEQYSYVLNKKIIPIIRDQYDEIREYRSTGDILVDGTEETKPRQYY